MRRRLVGAIMVVAAAAVILFAVPLALVLQRSYRDEGLLRLQRDAVAATRGVDLAGRASDGVELPRVAATALAAYDVAGRRVAGTGPARVDLITASALRDGRVAGRRVDDAFVVAVPLLTGEHVDGALRAVRATTGAAHDTREAWWLIAALAAGVLALAALAAVVIGRRMARPLERLVPVARRLGEGDFSVRAPAAGIAEIDAVAAALDATAQRLDDLLARERAFSADASHQLRTPLSALRLELEAVELRGDAAPEIATALTQVQRLQETIETLLSVGREAGGGSRSRTDLASLVEEAEARWRPLLAAEGRPLRTLVRAAAPVARVGPGVAREILDVLVDNARRHGEGAIVLGVREVDGPGELRSLALDVRDDGAGFVLDGMDPFARRTAGGVGQGHGIGLALARSLAEADGARLAISSSGAPTVLTLLTAGDE